MNEKFIFHKEQPRKSFELRKHGRANQYQVPPLYNKLFVKVLPFFSLRLPFSLNSILEFFSLSFASKNEIIFECEIMKKFCVK